MHDAYVRFTTVVLVFMALIGCRPSGTTSTVETDQIQSATNTFEPTPTKTLTATAVVVPTVVPTAIGFKLPEGDQPGQLEHHQGDPRPTIAFSSDGTILATGHQNGQVVLWDTRTGQQLQMLKSDTLGPMAEITALSFSSDNKLIAAAQPWLSRVNVWNVSIGAVEKTLEGGYAMTGAEFSPDGLLLAGGIPRGQNPPDLGQVVLWNTQDWSSRQVLDDVAPPFAFSHDGSFLATSSGVSALATGNENIQPGALVLWDVADGQQIKTVAVDGDILGMDYDTEHNLFAVSLIRTVSGRGENVLFVIDAETGEAIKELKAQSDEGAPIYGAVNLEFSPDASLLAAYFQLNRIVIWNVATAEQLRLLQGPSDELRFPVFSPDGTTLAASSSDGRILFWNVPNH
ncbi:MAG: PQQ-binding-like beta-propeller repeat protein [Anaerolineae bacterium]|nr:PQQ-binding-like beta-propeller repeat protein [Anaerolineae bacterium]